EEYVQAHVLDDGTRTFISCLIQEEVEQHNAEYVGEGAFVYHELLLRFRQDYHARKDDGAAHNGKRHCVHKRGEEIVDDEQVDDPGKQECCPDQTQERNEERPDNQWTFFPCEGEVERRFQHDHDQPHNAQHLEHVEHISSKGNICCLEAKLQANTQQDEQQNARNVGPPCDNAEKIGNQDNQADRYYVVVRIV